MADVRFEEGNELSSARERIAADEERVPEMARALIRFGLAKTVRGAKHILVIVTIISFASSIYFFWDASQPPTGTMRPPPPLSASVMTL